MFALPQTLLIPFVLIPLRFFDELSGKNLICEFISASVSKPRDDVSFELKETSVMWHIELVDIILGENF